MQLEIDERWIASTDQVVEDQFLHGPTLGCDGRWVPRLYEQRFQIIGKPVHVIVRILYGHQHVGFAYDRSFWNRLDFNGKPPTIFFENGFPTRPIEYAVTEVRVVQPFGLVDFFCRYDLADEILFQPILKSEEHSLWMDGPSPRFKVRINPSSLRWVLLVMTDFVRVGQPADVV